MSEHTIKIDKRTGEMSFVYSDELAPLVQALGATVTRASNVEPHPIKSGWLADMRPSGGPIIGVNGYIYNHALTGARFVETGDEPVDVAVVQPDPFTLIDGFLLRDDALSAERQWLRTEKGL